MAEDDTKQITGLLGEMHLAMKLHARGWQVHRAYIDAHTDFVLTKYWCTKCERYAQLEKRKKPTGNSEFPTDCCSICLTPSLQVEVRFVQVKTSEGVLKPSGRREYSFHAKLRSNIDPRSFYAWIALTPQPDSKDLLPHFYIFHHTEIDSFDDLSLASYQETDNQKTSLPIDSEGNITKKGTKHDYSCFAEFHNNFDKLEQPIQLHGEN